MIDAPKVRVSLLLPVVVFAIALSTALAQDAAPTPQDTDTSDPADRIPRLVMDTGAFNSAIRGLTFTPGGDQIFAAAGSDIRVWDVASGELLHTIRGFQSKDSGTINSIAIDPAGAYLAIAVNTTKGGYLRTCGLGALDHTEEYWGNPQTSIDQNEDLPGISLGARSAHALSFTNDGKYLSFIAAIKQASDSGPFTDQALYMFFDWENDELHDHGIVPNVQSQPGAVLGGTAGSFFGTHQHYVIPGLQSVFDVANKQNVDTSVSAELQWAFQTAVKLQSHYGGDQDISAALYDGNLPQKLIVYAFTTKRNGRDVYQCDVWSGNGNQPVVSYTNLSWAPTQACISSDGAKIAIGDALGNVKVFASQTGTTLFRSKSSVRALYAASLDQDNGILGLGNRPHSGAAWKLNDYADLDRGFDLRNRRFVNEPNGNFPRAKTSLDQLGLSSKSLRNDSGTFVRVTQPGAPDYSTGSTSRVNFSWNLSPGFSANDALLFRGGGRFLAADLIQIGTPANRFGTTNQGFFISQGSPENASIATDINHSADAKFITVAWTDGSAAIYQKSDFQPQRQAIIPFLGVPTDLNSMPIGQIIDPQAAGDLRIGDVLKAVNGKPVAVFVQDFFTQTDQHRIGMRMDAKVLRNGQPIDIPFRLIATPQEMYAPSIAMPALTLLSTTDDQWILYTPEGYYDASLGGHDLIGWKINRGPNETASHFTARQLRKSLYRPDLIDGVIDAMLTGKKDASVAVANLDNAQADSAPLPALDLQDEESLASILPPTITINGLPENLEINTETVSLTIEAESQNDLPVRSIVILLNGRPASGSPPLPKRTAGGGMTVTQTIKLPLGKNELAVMATNSAATSSPKTTTIIRVGESSQPATDAVKPKMYVLAVGVADYKIDSYDLEFAAKDAKAFADAFKAQKDSFYRDVETKVLTDADAERTAIQDAMDWLLSSVTQHDLAAIFISGHGVYDARRNFYFCSHEVDADKLRSTALAYTEIERLIQELPCKVLLFADTCHSGGTRGAKAINQDPWTDIVSDEVGAVLFASSTPQEESLESSEWGHGAFTRAFLDSLKQKKTDFNSDGYISITELDLSISERVKELTEGRQHPTTQKPSTIRNFNLAISGQE
ncbi:MAG: caspase family protein [Pirellulaceae bacterium]